MVATDQYSRIWAASCIPKLDIWEGASIKVGGVELLQKVVRTVVWVPGKPEEAVAILARLQRYNSTLKTGAWRILNAEKKSRRLGGINQAFGRGANSHSTNTRTLVLHPNLVWGNTNTNDWGTTLLEYLTTTNLEIINRGNEPTFMNAASKIYQGLESVGRILTLRPCTNFFYDYRGIATTGNMDQKPQANELSGIQKRPRGETQNRVPKGDTHDRGAKHCGRIVAEGKYEVPWGNNRLEKLKKATKALLKKAVKSNDNQKWIAWRSKQKEYRHAVRKAQTESWREYCSSVEAGKEPARLNMILARNPEA
ncbi:hypothetical protein TSAR_006303 [Trichomalopsis sarcophagae]|uniref:DUF4780 domain-containing protein n=1 Tax=Trichomalopsis sarcophagae TaxID=543379 RepID=A0A232EKN5_9HYME|nr:hypothetical protein TSAR_006303 [Trichomalopsis sarcophagae]